MSCLASNLEIQNWNGETSPLAHHCEPAQGLNEARPVVTWLTTECWMSGGRGRVWGEVDELKVVRKIGLFGRRQ